MNDTFKKYELMKELGIKIEPCPVAAHNLMGESATAAILERACREWLEKKGIEVTFRGDFFFLTSEGRRIDVAHIYNSFDAAQIAALEWCLKEKNTK